MSNKKNRRKFLRVSISVAGFGLLNKVLLRSADKRSTQLANPKFYWGAGIENCWIPQTDPARDGDRRLLDVYLQMQHYDKWKQDLELLSSTGVNCIRYSVPWYKAEPRPGNYDWSWIDKPIEYLVMKLKIIPILDLIHYGTPAWMPDGVIDDRFPDTIAMYAEAMALHFKGLVNHYSPHNEPQLTCIFCGLTGRWPPYEKSVESWAKIGVAVAKGMVMEMNAIRAVIPDAVIVSVDPWMVGVVDKFLPVSKESPDWTEISAASACFPASLAYGKVRSNHPFAAVLEEWGLTPNTLDWFQRNARLPDILGYNFYPDFGYGWGEGKEQRTKDFTRDGSVPLEKAAKEAVARITPGIKQAQRYFNLPVYLTETSAGLTIEARLAYIDALGEWVSEMQQQKLPLKGINWWPLFDTIQWDYREKTSLPLADFLYEGGWNNGLYRIEIGEGGDLKRISTPAVKAFRDIIKRHS